TAHSHFLAKGTTSGLGGYSLSLVNPLSTPAKAVLHRRENGVTVEEMPLDIPADHQQVLMWQVDPNSRFVKELSLEVSGDPLVIQALTWDSSLCRVRFHK